MNEDICKHILESKLKCGGTKNATVHLTGTIEFDHEFNLDIQEKGERLLKTAFAAINEFNQIPESNKIKAPIHQAGRIVAHAIKQWE